MRLTKLEVEHFRGYNDARSFDCLADVVILCGPNGSGKTSFFDALAWGLFGDIRRLRGSRDVVGQAHLRNYFSDADDPRVSIHVAEDDRTASVTRHGRDLLVVEEGLEHRGDAAERWIAERFRSRSSPEEWTVEDAERRFLSAHLLGQEEVAAFLRVTNPRDRFDALASLLGVDLVRAFYAHTGVVEKEARSGIRELDAGIARMNQRLEAIRVEEEKLRAAAPREGQPLAVEAVCEALADDAQQARSIGADVDMPVEGMPAAAVLEQGKTLRAALAGLISQSLTRQRQAGELRSSLKAMRADEAIRTDLDQQIAAQRASIATRRDRLAELVAEREANTQRLRQADASLAAAKAATDELQAFLLGAERFVTDDSCPLCEQPIPHERLLDQIHARVHHTPDVVRRLTTERAGLDERGRELAVEAGEAEATVATEETAVRLLESERDRIDEAAAGVRRAVIAGGFKEDATPEILAAELESTAQVTASVERLAARVDGHIAQLQYLSSADQRSRLEADAQRLQHERTAAEDQVAHARRSLELLQGITTAAKASELEIVRQLVRGQMPLLNALYQRLRPHPVLDQLDVDFGEFKERGEVYFHAVAGEARPNVSAIFSSAQLNAVAICIFLALSISAAPAGLTLLDDPIQNMDDFNVLGLLDLIRSVSTGRQVIVSTHDAELGDLMQRKLRPVSAGRRTIKHQFSGYDEHGPRLETEVEVFAKSPELIQALLG